MISNDSIVRVPIGPYDRIKVQRLVQVDRDHHIQAGELIKG